MKFLKGIIDNFLFFATLFLLAFIPLYPKIPLVDIKNTWVYIRWEDFLVVLTIFGWVLLYLYKKINLKTPLTIPIFLYWIIGGVATLHGVLLIFPTQSDVFSNVAFLSYLRRIEYMILFFIAFSSIRDKKYLTYVIASLSFIVLAVVFYGLGQKFLGFPAFLTGNEEFAKGVALRVSELGRIPSTFAGHYDLAAYLVLLIPIFASLVFGVKNILIKIYLSLVCLLGFGLLLLTVSRVSFFVLLLSLSLLLVFYKKKFAIIILLVLAFLFLTLYPRLLDRFNSTFTEIDVLVDAKTGYPIGKVTNVPSIYFKDKIVFRHSKEGSGINFASESAIMPFTSLPEKADLVVEPNAPTGEYLPQGTSYVNLPLSPVIKKTSWYFYEKSGQLENKPIEILSYNGDFVVKRAKAYDLSFTTRFQGEWPRTMRSFSRNILIGNGYGSVSLAVDNDYLRMLGETGLLGFLTFASIFVVSGIYIFKLLPKIESNLVKSFAIGFVMGTFGLLLNATLIDVFEASKVAYTFWLLMGVTIGILKYYEMENINLFKEFISLVTSPIAVILYLILIVVSLYFQSLGNYFVGDDFTWFRWVSNCVNCTLFENIFNYFSNANGFFYRPGTKLYFLIMHSLFWLNQVAYHLISMLLHILVVVMIFIISKRILKNILLASIAAIIFSTLSGHHEAIFWVSSTGFLFNALFALLSLYFFMLWRERRKLFYLLFSLISIVLALLFHEVGVIVPLIIILYDTIFSEYKLTRSALRTYLIIFSPIIPYILIRFVASSHWFSGDYSYNLVKLPFNLIGNLLGYIMFGIIGPSSYPLYDFLRTFSRENIFISFIFSILIIFLVIKFYKLFVTKLIVNDKKVVIFSFLFFVVALLPFLGLGNITSRYSYLPSVGFSFLVTFLLAKTYKYLLINGKPIAIAIVILISIIFASNHLFQLQRIQESWRKAGEISKNVIASLDFIYAHYSEIDLSHIYLVDIPIRHKDAWVFPVGLTDAAWLVFRNDNVKIYQVNTVSDAFYALGNFEGHVLKFENDGSFVEMKKRHDGTITPEY